MTLLALLTLLLAPMAVLAAADDEPESSAAGHVAPAPPANAVPEMPYAQMATMMDMDDSSRLGRILVDQWEWRDDAEHRASGVWDAEGWYGDDYNKLWVRTEGDWASGAGAQGRAELLWERIVARRGGADGGARCGCRGGGGRR